MNGGVSAWQEGLPFHMPPPPQVPQTPGPASPQSYEVTSLYSLLSLQEIHARNLTVPTPAVS